MTRGRPETGQQRTRDVCATKGSRTRVRHGAWTLGIVALLAVAGPSAGRADDTSAEDGDFRTRAVLSGERWREPLSRRGVSVAFDASWTVQGVATGGYSDRVASVLSDEDDVEQTLSGRLLLELDTGAAGLWDGGVFTLSVEGRAGSSVLTRAGSIAAVNNDALFPNVVDRYDQETAAVTELTYEHAFGEWLCVYGGLLNTAEGDDNAIAGSALSRRRFLNSALLYSLTEDSTVPNVAPGVGIGLEPADEISGSFSVFGTTERAGEDPFDGYEGTTFSTEWTVGHDLFGRGGAQTVGFLYGIDGDRTALGSGRRSLIESILSGQPLPSSDDDTWAVYYNAHQYVAGSEDHGWGLFLRWGVSDGDPNPVRWTVSGGLGGVGLLPGRDEDAWGAGVYGIGVSDEELIRVLGIDDEVGGEVYYGVQVAGWMQVTLDVQLVDAGLPRADTALLAGTRVHVEF